MFIINSKLMAEINLMIRNLGKQIKVNKLLTFQIRKDIRRLNVSLFPHDIQSSSSMSYSSNC